MVEKKQHYGTKAWNARVELLLVLLIKPVVPLTSTIEEAAWMSYAELKNKLVGPSRPFSDFASFSRCLTTLTKEGVVERRLIPIANGVSVLTEWRIRPNQESVSAALSMVNTVPRETAEELKKMNTTFTDRWEVRKGAIQRAREGEFVRFVNNLPLKEDLSIS